MLYYFRTRQRGGDSAIVSTVSSAAKDIFFLFVTSHLAEGYVP